MKKILITVMFALATLWAGEDSTTVEFDHATLAIEGGALHLLDDANRNLDDSYYGLLELDYTYFRKWIGVVQFGYSYLTTRGDVD